MFSSEMKLSKKMKKFYSEDKLCETTKNSLLLKSMITENNNAYIDSSDKIEHENELMVRLKKSQKKLEHLEESIDASWHADSSLFDTKESVAVENSKLPDQIEENILGIIQSGKEYIDKLGEQLNDLDSAEEQVNDSMQTAINEIDSVCNTLLDDACKAINNRRALLKLEAEIHKNEGLIPLKACRQEVKAQIQGAQQFIDLIQIMLQCPYMFNRDRFSKITAASSNIGKIPAVPYPEEVPSINFCPPSISAKNEILERISELGYVLRVGPVQIIDIEERPGALFIKWAVTDTDYCEEEQIFVVQKAHGEIIDPASTEFQIVYIGSGTSCLIRDLPLKQPVTFRVRIQSDNVAWSMHKICQTTIPAYSWESSNENYLITSNGRIATKVTDNLSTLFSQGPQFDSNYTIEITFLEISYEGTNNEGIALVSKSEGPDDTLRRPGSLMITPQGKIYMDGEEKLMQLPKIRSNSTIIFTIIRKECDLLRINIECADRVVTYDWNTEAPLFFAARFKEHKWTFIVK
ncbi:cytokine receptor-like factor 3 [Prorops nasuta]|uniref:cytokine receptor-like factor 3 n=1 Tax=Prorops nasuta TaxID=863751 RepID=UPI0034CE8FE8